MALFVEKILQPLYRKYNKWGTQEIYPASLFSGSSDLENSFSVIQAEYKELIKRYDDFAPFQEISPHQIEISNDDKWRLFFLKGANIWFPKNCEQMPETVKIISDHSSIISAYVSVLGPRKVLNPHAGPYSGVLRLHLALDIPNEKKCYLMVNGKKLHWEEGKCVLFDDTYEHTAVNDTDEIRSVLFIDIVKPLPFPINVLNWCVIRMARLFSYVNIPLKRHKEWQKIFYGDGNG